MTVAALLIAATVDEALAAVEGQPAVRRLADLAWSGGALPIVVVAPDGGGRVAAALAGAPVTLAQPAPPGGDAAAIVRGLEVAVAEVRETDGVIVWPAAHVWVGPETITSLIEAHGLARDVLVVPTWNDRPGWPVLVPSSAVQRLRSVDAMVGAGEAIARLAADGLGTWPVNLGDPGAVLDAATARADLPPYEGPAAPVGGVAPEWGAAIADAPEDAPLSGPALAPWPQAGEEDELG